MMLYRIVEGKKYPVILKNWIEIYKVMEVKEETLKSEIIFC